MAQLEAELLSAVAEEGSAEKLGEDRFLVSWSEPQFWLIYWSGQQCQVPGLRQPLAGWGLGLEEDLLGAMEQPEEEKGVDGEDEGQHVEEDRQ